MRVSADVRLPSGRTLGALVSGAPRPEDPLPIVGGDVDICLSSDRDICVARGWLPGRPLTGFGRRRPNLPLPSERVKSGAACIRLHPNGLASVETTTGRPLILTFFSGECFLRDPRVGARKTLHRIRPKTADSASPPGEGEERRPEDSLATDAGASLGEGGRAARERWLPCLGVGGRGRATLTPALSLKGEGGKGVATRGSCLRTQVLAYRGREHARLFSSGEGSGGA